MDASQLSTSSRSCALAPVKSGLANRGIALSSSNYFEADFDALPADIRRRRRSACERVADKPSAVKNPVRHFGVDWQAKRFRGRGPYRIVVRPYAGRECFGQRVVGLVCAKLTR